MRFSRLTRELEEIKRKGKIEMEIQKKKIEDNYARDLEDFKHKA